MDKQSLLILAAVPATVPVVENETDAQFLERWKKVDILSAEKKEILSSEMTIEKIGDVAKRFRLTYEETCDISRLVRSIVFGEITVLQIDSYLTQKIQHLGQPDRDNVKNVIVEILSQQQIQSVENKKSGVQLPLSQALTQYPKLGEQNITIDQIKLRFMPSLVRPSIKNWITDFHDAMGAMKHSPIDRGNFLFHSENGKKLSPADRQKLGTILKSLDEQSLLNIDTELQVVIFDEAEQNRIDSNSNLPSRNVQTQVQENSVASTRQSSYQYEPIDGDIIGQVQSQRETRPDINLRQNTIQSQSNSQSTFRSPMPTLVSAPVTKPAPLIGQQFSRPIVSASIAPSIPTPVENRNDFFAIAQSKPPIGSEHFSAPVAAPEKQVVVSEKIQDRDSMSDELLYKALQEKSGAGKAASAQGVVSFSSAQKLPAEQGIVQPQQARTVQASPYHISPTPHLYEKKETTPKIQGNVVDLKN